VLEGGGGLSLVCDVDSKVGYILRGRMWEDVGGCSLRFAVLGGRMEPYDKPGGWLDLHDLQRSEPACLKRMH
jgi:hypothetical protein